jgi:hypothetical protein
MIDDESFSFDDVMIDGRTTGYTQSLIWWLSFIYVEP